MGKTPYIEFKFEVKNKELLKYLETLSSNEKMRPYVKEAINRAGKRYLKVLKDEAFKKYKIKARSSAYFNEFIKTRLATNSNLEFRAEIRSKPLNMIRFAELRNRRVYRKDGGVTVVKKQKVATSIEIIRGKKIKLQTRGPKAWFVGNKGRTLFRRQKGEKKAIEAVSTLSPTQMLGRKEFKEKANKAAEKMLNDRINNAIKNFKF